ncbi:unnamed protein product [Triticum turgidum subsp. durum]|uniref:BZIP domain-containing protein n=1 Tax=Triticum turgidum subsp. durum TaxID=4567 RepID=A0A9R0TF63_TRITD|nr:unnamed protein product [Triticum turgidum subsp. durum]
MDDGDLDFSNPEAYLCSDTGADLPGGGCSMDSYFDGILNDTEHLACTHTHTCNPPVDDTVRKYREKKKAHTALLEEEVVQLKALNKQLLKKLQNHAALEAEAARLRCLLVDIRGRIDGEIGTFPYQRPVKNVDLVSGVDQGGFLGSAQVMNSCDFRCNDQMYCNTGMQMRTMGDDGAMSGQDFQGAVCHIFSLAGAINPVDGRLYKSLASIRRVWFEPSRVCDSVANDASSTVA